ncbi:hypothetical protein CgunFtcFv8_001478 [Champsocephalus gunnari]|uniref:Immunoglobulin V-set domain-containing protein n=1 Tax=Champsocephalus gunnari TaxID=52237 RepID=A0AAN8CNG1_CHAGU|nr:hypothetical protein CgunFtcFv8_001478 [Champsocephalus gunnari]
MEALGWSCVLGILCLPAEVLLHTWTVSQEPSSTSIKTINSSAEISCSTSLSDPVSLSLQRNFHSRTDVSFLYFQKGTIKKMTMTEELQNRIQVSERKQLDGGVGVSFKIDMMQLQDTDLYFCTWSQEDKEPVTLATNGTIIIVREEDPQGTLRVRKSHPESRPDRLQRDGVHRHRAPLHWSHGSETQTL